MAWNTAQTNLLLTLFQGFVIETDTFEPTEFQRVDFSQMRQVMRGVGDELTRVDESYRSDREMSLGMMRSRIDSAQAEIDSLAMEAMKRNNFAVEQALGGPRDLSDRDPVPQLPPSAGSARYIQLADEGTIRRTEWEAQDRTVRRTTLEMQVLRNQIDARQGEINRLTVEYHKKFAIPVACIVFVLVGAPIAVRFPRGGAGMVIAISLFVFGVYYMSLIGGESLGDRGVIRPFWGPWAPNLGFAILAVLGLARIGKETSSSRGGGWDDLWLTVRAFLTKPFRRRHTASARAS
jgi:lipopolysaccharide export system permease protein